MELFCPVKVFMETTASTIKLTAMTDLGGILWGFIVPVEVVRIEEIGEDK